MTRSSSTEDDGAVLAPLTFWAAMAKVKVVQMMREGFYVDKTNILSAQSATLI